MTYDCTFVSVRVAHQRVDVMPLQSTILGEVSLEDDEEKEEPQHHVTEVTEDVVESAVWNE